MIQKLRQAAVEVRKGLTVCPVSCQTSSLHYREKIDQEEQCPIATGLTATDQVILPIGVIAWNMDGRHPFLAIGIFVIASAAFLMSIRFRPNEIKAILPSRTVRRHD